MIKLLYSMLCMWELIYEGVVNCLPGVSHQQVLFQTQDLTILNSAWLFWRSPDANTSFELTCVLDHRIIFSHPPISCIVNFSRRGIFLFFAGPIYM